MTDKERIENTYRKIRNKYPNIISKTDIDNLAIKLEKRNTLLLSLGYFLGALLCGVVFFLLIGNETYEMTRYIFLVMTGSGIVESFRTLAKYSKIEQWYKPVLNTKYEGQLTKEKIILDGGKVLKNSDYVFEIFRVPLCDKEDEVIIGIDNDTHHKQYLHFIHPKNNLKIVYKVSRKEYIEAVIGSEYFVVVTPSNEIAAVYQATNWSVDNQLSEILETSQPEKFKLPDEELSVKNCETPDMLYQPNGILIEPEPKKTQKVLPILSIVLAVLSYLMPMIIGVFLIVAGLVLAIVGLAKQRSIFSILALCINIVVCLNLFFVTAWLLWK